MNKKILIFLLFITSVVFSQSKGTITGVVYDKEADNSPLPFANVFIKGETIGTTSDFDGNYTLTVNPGTYTLVFSFIGYETIELPNVIVKAKEVIKIDKILNASTGVSLMEVQITGSTKKESETALLSEQKKATVIKESIGSQRLAKLGISDAATATSKITGVTKNEGSGDIYIRGLGDRYLSTTMNGLPIPSDDVEKKNIDLNLFSTDIIQNIGISKTYTVEGYGDQASGSVNIVSKQYGGERFTIDLSAGSNTNVLDMYSDFKSTQNLNDVNLGFYKKEYALVDAISYQSWNTLAKSNPIDFEFGIKGGGRFEFLKNDVSVFFTASHANSYEYESGIYKKFRSNVLDNSFSDAESFSTKINTTGLFDLKYRLGSDHKISFNSLFVNKTSDNLYEQGRNGEGYVFDQDPAEEGAFVRDQNLKQTRLMVNQLIGEHTTSEKNILSWALGYNYVWATEPNRIRNEVNILDESTVQFAHVGDFQQRKSSQKIVDTEYNGYIKDVFTFNPEAELPLKLTIGGNFRNKERDFNSTFKGVRAKGVQVNSIDDLSAGFVRTNFNNGTVILRDRDPDFYNASLKAMAGFSTLEFGYGKFTGVIGARYESNQLNVDWNVGNYVGRIGSVSNDYNYVLPSLNLKYELNDLNFLRLAVSKTITLPEFKEIAPFEYVSPTGRVIKGNPSLKESENYNFDLKWEFFPSSKELISLSSFYKNIKNPINLSQTRGSSGNFVFDNTGEEATVFGVEFEARQQLLDSEKALLNFNFNATKMWFNQDLLDEFKYNNKIESDLQGASDLIFNAAISYSNYAENKLEVTLSGNYSSDKIFALGAPEDFANSSTLFNDEIIEKGFVSLDFVLNKAISEHFSISVKGKNLLDPSIKQTQNIKNLNTQNETEEIVSSYKKGLDLSFGIKYTF